jgi:hypothetical protein
MTLDQSPSDEDEFEDALCPCGSGFPQSECCPEGEGAAIHPPGDPRQKLKVLFALTVSSFVLGLLFFFPYLEEEHRRMDPWKGVLVWVGDVTGLIWFTYFFTRHYVLGKPFRDEAGPSDGVWRGWWLAFVSLAGAIGFDLWITFSLQGDERAGLARAVVTQGQIDSIKRTSAAEFHQYSIHCRFQDGQGNWEVANFTIGERRRTGSFPAGLPLEVGQAIRNGQVPSPIPIAYDPERPARNWVAGIDPGDGHRFHAFALCILLFQGLAIMGFVTTWREEMKKNPDKLPWWYDLHMVLPFMVEAGFLGFFGGLIWGLGWIVEVVFN